VVTIYRGVNADVPGIDLSHAYETSNVRLDQLSTFNAGQVQQGIGASSLYDAERTVQRLAANQQPTSTGGG
jgi:protein phosphatase